MFLKPCAAVLIRLKPWLADSCHEIFQLLSLALTIMSKQLWLEIQVLAAANLVLVACAGPAVNVSIPTATALPTPPLVQLAWFYKPPADRNLPALAQHYSTFILSHAD